MSVYLDRKIIIKRAVEVAAPDDVASRDHSLPDGHFGLPKGLHIATLALYLGCIAVYAIALGEAPLIVPLGICMLIVTAFFVTPALWARTCMHAQPPLPGSSQTAPNWSSFLRDGVDTINGRLKAWDASVQVLILPVLIFLWSLTIAVLWVIMT